MNWTFYFWGVVIGLILNHLLRKAYQWWPTRRSRTFRDHGTIRNIYGRDRRWYVPPGPVSYSRAFNKRMRRKQDRAIKYVGNTHNINNQIQKDYRRFDR